MLRAAADWWFTPMPDARVRVFRVVIYLFVVYDVLFIHNIAANHAHTGELYRPLEIAELLSLPQPTPVLITAVQWTLIASCLLSAAGWFPRVSGTIAFLAYFEWCIMSFSYGKVDHDRIALLVALAVLPTVGRALAADRTLSAAAGWALRCVQVAVIATYFLSAFAKFRFGGFDWANGATLVRAVFRRSTVFSEWMLDVPWVLHAGQWAILLMELSAPVIFLVALRWRYAMVGMFVAFHIATYMVITIVFLPHTICLVLAFLPTEKLVWWARDRFAALRGGRTGTAPPPGGAAAGAAPSASPSAPAAAAPAEGG
ncbi:hypothetical protein CLV72_10872 [Allonocardiopsis opalescens]|uniref:HTTM-like domain-containing protein n=2 Tax=Allonocardiopsis opalescens TaxID=1144618 RepID=A0A2T0PXA5_9ACTN|nr:hypothetical protein CLV72_10872 [Allonocardiopsis opalescens]